MSTAMLRETADAERVEVIDVDDGEASAPALQPLRPARADAHLVETVRAACARIAPLRPLRQFVAVNPFLGVAELPFEAAAARLARVAGARLLLPRAEYRALLDRKSVV